MRSLGLLLAATIAGCATLGPRTTTWEQDAAEGVRTTRAPEPTRPARLVTPPPDLDPSMSGPRLSAALARFSRDLRGLADAETALWAWGSALSELERALAFPTGSLGRPLVARARVVLEAERDRFRRRFGALPNLVARRYARAHAALLRRLAELAPVASDPNQPELSLSWPVSPLILTSGFGYRRDPVHGDGRLGFHAGLDLAGGMGDVVRAAADGEVIAAGWNGGYGRAVMLRHVSGFITVYGHLSKVLVEVGHRVSTDDPVGLMGQSGRATGAHLHFELRRGGTPLDPTDLVAAP